MSLGFDRTNVNLITSPKYSSLNYRSAPTQSSKILHTSKGNKSAGRTTGDYVKKNDGVYWKVLLNNTSHTEAYVRQDVTKFNKPSSNPNITAEQAQKIVNKLVNNDIKIFDSLIRSGNMLKRLDSSGIDVIQYKKTYGDLLARYGQRQQKIKESRFLKWKTSLKKGQAKGLEWIKTWTLYQYPDIMINAYGKVTGIGAIPIVAVIIGAIIGAGLAVGVYFAFKPSYSESEQDLVMSADLEKALTSLSPSVAESVKKDLEKQIDDAYNQGRTDGTFSGMFKVVTPILLATLSYWGVTKILKNQKKKGKEE